MKKNKSISFLMISVTLTLITSCKRDIVTDPKISIIATVNEESQAAAINEGIVSIVDQYVSIYNFANPTLNDPLPVITVTPNDSITFPKTFTVDFGNTGFTEISGSILKGKIIAIVNDKMWKSNIHKVVTFNDFYINGNKISGIDTIKTAGLYLINPITKIVAKDTITRADGTKTIWKSYRVRTLVDNSGTPDIVSDDKFSITGGSSNGINSNGVSYATFITPSNPLIWFNNYTFYVQGSVTVATENKVALIDFGAGLMDDQSIITIDSIANIYTLKK